MDLHRKLGLLYVSGMIVGSIGAIGLSVQTDFGWVFGAGLFSLAIAWILTTCLAFIAIPKGQVQQHKEWTIRSYVVTFARLATMKRNSRSVPGSAGLALY
jgi:arginine exporter protein ArgO